MEGNVELNCPSSYNSKNSKAMFNQKIMKFLCTSCGIFVAGIIFSIIGFIGKQGVKVFNDVSIIEFFTSSVWSPSEAKFGILPFITGTLILTFLSVFIGGVLGVFSAIFMAKIAPKKLRNILRIVVDLFVGIPSVVYGYIGLTVVVPLLRSKSLFPNSSGFGFLPAAIILGIMILPTIINISENSIRSVDTEIEYAAYALGSTRLQTINKIILPNALPGILASIILAMARALGETMAVLMVIGGTPQLTTSLLTPTSVLTTGIVLDMGNTQFGTTWSNALFMMSTLLLIISLILILFIRTVLKKGGLKYD